MFRNAVALGLIGMLGCLVFEPSLADQGHAHEHKGGQGTGNSVSPAGAPGEAVNVSRTINVRMLDSMQFEPSTFKVKRGETVRFVVSNAGLLRHEFGIGTAEEQEVHAEMMLADPEMKHDDGGVITVEPGKVGTLIWRFREAGEYEAACQVPGHYTAGMKARTAVSAH